MAIMNLLNSKEEIDVYKEWLSKKPYHFLKCLMATFDMHSSMNTNKYPKLSLRIELVNKELQKKSPTN